MRGSPALALLLLIACGGEPATPKTPGLARAARRAFDGAPPVIPHQPQGAACTSCHDERGREVAGTGFAPPSPHGKERALGELGRCEQCHVYAASDAAFRESAFAGLPQDLRHGVKMHEGAPPVIPHQVWMRENCLACHTGPAAREEIFCDHPERGRCAQCHVPAVTRGEFQRGE